MKINMRLKINMAAETLRPNEAGCLRAASLTLTYGEFQMKYVFVSLLVVLCVNMCWGEDMAIDVNSLTAEELSWHGILDMVDKSEVVVVGTVELMTPELRRKVINGHGDFIMTDVLVRVSKFIKGRANVGANHVKFAIHGGTAYIPERQQVETHEMVQEVKFEVGEQVMLFLRNKNDEPYYANYPHGRHRVHMLDFGKRLIQDGKVSFLYGTEGDADKTDLPLGLAKALGKAYQEDKNATIALENQIKALSVLSDDKVRELTNSAKRIAGGK